MIGMAQLEKLKYPEVGTIAPEKLIDISDVTIMGKTAAERLESLLSQMPNPYYYKVEKTAVHISFAPDAAPLEDKLKAYFIGLKQNTFGAQINP